MCRALFCGSLFPESEIRRPPILGEPDVYYFV